MSITRRNSHFGLTHADFLARSLKNSGSIQTIQTEVSIECEGGFSSQFLTTEDHEFFRDAAVRAEAFDCLGSNGTRRAMFISIEEDEAYIADPRNWPVY